MGYKWILGKVDIKQMSVSSEILVYDSWGCHASCFSSYTLFYDV